MRSPEVYDRVKITVYYTPGIEDIVKNNILPAVKGELAYWLVEGEMMSDMILAGAIAEDACEDGYYYYDSFCIFCGDRIVCGDVTANLYGEKDDEVTIRAVDVTDVYDEIAEKTRDMSKFWNELTWVINERLAENKKTLVYVYTLDEAEEIFRKIREEQEKKRIRA